MGELFSWGSNMYGQAAHREKIVPKARKVEVSLLKKVYNYPFPLSVMLFITRLLAL